VKLSGGSPLKRRKEGRIKEEKKRGSPGCFVQGSPEFPVAPLCDDLSRYLLYYIQVI